MKTILKNLKSLSLFSEVEITDDEQITEIKLNCISSYYPMPNNNLIAKVEEKDKHLVLTAFSTYVSIKSVIIDENGENTLRLEFCNKNGKTERDFPASILSATGIKTLLTYGVNFNAKGGSYLIDYLLCQQEYAPAVNVYSSLGWCEYNGELAFKFDYMYVKEGYFDDVLYNGDYCFESSGSFDVWEEMVINEVCGNTPMEFVLAAGFASPVLAFLDETYDLGTMLFNLSNTTTKGKTTAARLAASIFGNPKLGCSTMLSYNATKNALPETIAKFNGITVAMDEAAILKSRGFSKLLYALCSGTTKSRIQSTKGGISLGKVNHFSNVIISTAEYDLLNDDSEGGLRVRVFEINDTFTKSSENSIKIKKTVSKNYGGAGIGFINHLLENHNTDMKQGYLAVIKELKKEIPTKTDITDRLIERFAVILLTAKYCNDCGYFRFTLNYDALLDYTVNLIQAIDHRQSYEERIKDLILEDYSMNNSCYFPTDEMGGQTYYGTRIRGFVRSEEDSNYYYIMPSVFKQLMKDKKIPNVNSKLRQLRESGVLLTEDDRLTKRITVQNNERLSMYCFRFKKGE